MKNQLTEIQEMERGQLLAKVLNLKKRPNGWYDTEWGTKTDLGSFRTVKRIIEKGDGGLVEKISKINLDLKD